MGKVVFEVQRQRTFWEPDVSSPDFRSGGLIIASRQLRSSPPAHDRHSAKGKEQHPANQHKRCNKEWFKVFHKEKGLGCNKVKPRLQEKG
jgi:hypothetical protein